MNSLLRALRDATGLPLRPGEVVVQRNVGSCVGGTTDHEDHLSWRGFNLLLLDTRGVPVSYAKCRPSCSARAARERELHLRLARDEPVGGLLPAARELNVGEVGVLLLDFIDGPTLRAGLKGLAWREAKDRIAAVMGSAGRLVARAAELGLSDEAGDVQSGPRPWHGARHWLERAGAEPFLRAELQRCMELVDDMCPVPQHGDLTVDNILDARGRIVFLDLETVGECDIPLRDDWSMARSLPSPRDRARRQDWWHGEPAQAVLERARLCGMSLTQSWATLPVYLADYAGTLMARGVPAEFAIPYLSEAERVLRERCSDPKAFS